MIRQQSPKSFSNWMFSQVHAPCIMITSQISICTAKDLSRSAVRVLEQVVPPGRTWCSAIRWDTWEHDGTELIQLPRTRSRSRRRLYLSHKSSSACAVQLRRASQAHSVPRTRTRSTLYSRLGKTRAACTLHIQHDMSEWARWSTTVLVRAQRCCGRWNCMCADGAARSAPRSHIVQILLRIHVYVATYIYVDYACT